MRDWQRFVADRLAGSRLAPELRQEVAGEIAAHLEECHDELVKAGNADAQADAGTLAQVADWNALGRKIRRAKEDPMNFVKRVVMPGAAALIVALAALKLFVYLLIAPQPCGPELTCIAVTADGPVYLPWLATLPPAGALAAALARWMGARPIQRVLAAVSPALYLAVEATVLGAFEGVFYWRIPIYWVVIPAIACAIGAIPFLGRMKSEELRTKNEERRTRNGSLAKLVLRAGSQVLRS